MTWLLRVFAWLFLLLLASSAAAEPLRIVVAVGHNVGMSGESTLRFPQGDAQRVARLFLELGGVKKENAIVLADPSPDQLYAALAKAQAMARARRPDEVSFLFYYSGHGDREHLHLGPFSVATDEVKRRVADVPAALRVLVTDACRNVDSRSKGMAAEAPFAVKLDEGVGARGIVWLHASGDGEAAQESDQLGSALFTHYWASGLRGAADRNGDGNVSLSESYEYAYSQTLLRSARSSGVVQRPEAIYELRELTPVVLTRPAASSRIALPRDSDTHYLVYALGSKSIVAEAFGDSAKSVELGVAPGRYLVHRRAHGKGSAFDFVLARKEARQLIAADFRDVAEERLARKGGDLVLRPNEIDAAFGLVQGTQLPVGQTVRLGYFHNEGGLGFGARVAGSRGASTTAAHELDLLTADARVLAEYRLRLGPATLRAGAGPVAAVLSQRRIRRDAARLAEAGYSAHETSAALALGGAVFVGARASLTSAVYAELGFGFDVLGARFDAAPSTTAEPAGPSVRALAAGHADLAVGLQF